ncbi:hypothetical protein A8709_00255 [Paenibacillus pectinilyticus]|uniref:Phytanoyl-CoA dioxygenase n=2 Tax=Paenibacillus pectinilyticus TaxID=512399 RepID=A0A1C1A0Q6_9BACL|nr:hypothetical protein A8709_00255 [Paenibacillus pectinilyticus]
MDNAMKQPSKDFEDSTALLKHPGALHDKADQDGYLFFRGLLSNERVFRLRKQILHILERRGLLSCDTDIMDGVADPENVSQLVVQGTYGVGVSTEIYLEVQQLEEFHAIAQDPELLNVFKILFGSEPFPHPRNICRLIMPHPSMIPTPPHQDFLYIQGSSSTWTCWFPLGDCPRELGGLAMLEGSHKLGLLNVTGSSGAGGLESLLCGLNLEWAYGDYLAGDVVMFKSHTVHKAMPNQMGNKIRLSCDFRYQPEDQVIDRSSLKAHGGFTWEEIYKDWKNEDLKYYWDKDTLTFSDWDKSIHIHTDKIC